jgi:hypothetical protein
VGYLGSLGDGEGECRFIRFRWLREPADLPHELKRRCLNLVVRDGRIEIE